MPTINFDYIIICNAEIEAMHIIMSVVTLRDHQCTVRSPSQCTCIVEGWVIKSRHAFNTAFKKVSSLIKI